MVNGMGRDESGSVGPLVVLMLPVLVLVMSLVVDVGLLFVCKNLSATAVDMAALAAAQEVDLDRLARGERYINPQAAENTARTWIKDNLDAALIGLAGSPSDGEVYVDVTVYNASKNAPLMHEPLASERRSSPVLVLRGNEADGRNQTASGNGRMLTDPTVCVTMSLPVKNGLLLGRLIPAVIMAHADTSVMEKAR